MSQPTPSETVEKLQNSLQTKAKAEPAFRFYALWDKVYREDILLEAYRRCCPNAGAAGVDGETFARIETIGVERWLGMLREELKSGNYESNPLLRVWLPKGNRGQRPLGITTIRERVAQMASLLVIGPIFEAELLPQQYGFRPVIGCQDGCIVSRPSGNFPVTPSERALVKKRRRETYESLYAKTMGKVAGHMP